MEKSRTKNTLKNMGTGMIVQIVNKVMAFVVRTVFINILNVEYLGVNGLFTNILTILSFTELGIGTAIIFNMYKPVAEENVQKIKGLMKLYKKAYNIIGITVFVLGLLVIPFMDLIINEAPNIQENIIGIYILFLINTASSYFFTYKKSIISAYQQESVINKFDSIFYFIKSIFEIIFLVTTRNYIVYLIVGIVMTILQNMLISRKADKMFPYLKETDEEKLSRDEVKGIFKNVKSLVIYKFGSVIMNGTDNILISSMIDVKTVGLCSNYMLVINAVKNVLVTTLNGITASIGNLNAGTENSKKEEIYYQLIFINFWIYLFCAVAFMILLNPFIDIWLGDAYILDISVPIALSVSFFIEGLRMPSYTYRITMGLFEKGKATPYIGAIANIIFSIIFVKWFGVAGIFWGTCAAQLVSYVWIDPYLIYKYRFKESFSKFIMKYAKYFIIFIIISVITYLLTRFTFDGKIITLILKSLVVLIIPNLLVFLLFRKSEEYLCLNQRIANLLKEKMNIRK